MINVNQQALLELLKASLFGAEPHFPEGVDWDAVLQEAKDQTVVALAAPAVPKEEADKWQIPAAQNKMRFFQILDEQTNLVKIFQDAGIPMVILKGSAAAMYYPEPFLRTMGDIDFIVPSERFEEACYLMKDNGYDFDHDQGDDRDYSYRKGNIILELHHRYSDKEWDIDPLIMEGLANSEFCEVYCKEFSTLPVEINGMVLLDHVRHHLLCGLGIRQIIDWMMFVHAFLNDEAWKNRFAPLARNAGLETFAITMTKMCRQWFGLPDAVTWCDGADEVTVQQLLKTLFEFGNFGKKELGNYRPAQSITMSIRKQGLFQHLQKTGKKNWNACQRHMCLRPFAWLYQLFRYAFKGFSALIRGERFANDYVVGANKSGFFESLGLNR